MTIRFIAEASSNNGRDLGRALAFVDAAAGCGCDAVKFQLFRIADLFAPEILAKSPAIETIRAATGISTGWSDHTRNPAVIERAVHRWNACAVDLRADGEGFKGPVAAEISDREWRAGPVDGLRPMAHLRTAWAAE